MLVKALEENGIGRPSTYAPTINTIQQRGYVERRDDNGKEHSITQIILDQQQITQKTMKKFV